MLRDHISPVARVAKAAASRFHFIPEQRTHTSTMKTLRPAWTPLLVLIAAMTWCASAHAQTAFWINGSPSEWNTAANWNIDLTGYAVVPGVGTNIDIGTATPGTVNYNTPMAASSVAALSLINSTLNINAAGFNLDTAGTTTSPLNIGSAGSPGTWQRCATDCHRTRSEIDLTGDHLCARCE